MLDYITLKRKGKLYYINDNNTEEEFVDLLTKTYEVMDYSSDNIIIVNKYYVARPDLISLAVYGDDRYADLICKYNGISNPFELNENDVILIPSMNEIKRHTSFEENKSELISDSNTIINTKKYPGQKQVNEKRSPIESVVGEENFIIDKSLGIIFY